MIDKRKKYYVILDTETTSDKTPEENQQQKIMTKFVYDLGYTIATKKEIVIKRKFLIKEIYTNNFLMDNAYFKSKKPKYDEMVANNEIEIKPFAEVIKTLQQDINETNASAFCAYNVGFDLDAIMQTTNLIYPNKFKMIFKKTKSDKFAPDTQAFLKKYIVKKDIEIIDIWTLACQTLCNQKTFKAFYKQLTEKGNIKSNAEIVYNYINGTTDFVEEHTALSDSIIETEILQRILRIHQKIDSKFAFMPFRMITKEA